MGFFRYMKFERQNIYNRDKHDIMFIIFSQMLDSIKYHFNFILKYSIQYLKIILTIITILITLYSIFSVTSKELNMENYINQFLIPLLGYFTIVYLFLGNIKYFIYVGLERDIKNKKKVITNKIYDSLYLEEDIYLDNTFFVGRVNIYDRKNKRNTKLKNVVLLFKNGIDLNLYYLESGKLKLKNISYNWINNKEYKFFNKAISNIKFSYRDFDFILYGEISKKDFINILDKLRF